MDYLDYLEGPLF